MATFVIGGKDRVVRPLNFHWMQNAYPALDRIMSAPAPTTEAEAKVAFGESIDAILTVVAEGLDQERELLMLEAAERGETIDPGPPAPKKETLAKLLRPDEAERLHEPVFELLRESGMRLGELTPAKGGAGDEAAPGSTETSSG